ncbi:Very-long-chain 3-oxoacyl-CoA synthase [Psidium guajava]|nr:Very-long-chain 3-oxoacyl-CoA synthase [Psidium guajava]
MSPILSTVEYWLVHHPAIHNFRWEQGQTLASSALFLTLAVLSYLSLTFVLSRLLPPPTLGPHLLKPIAVLHNLALTVLPRHGRRMRSLRRLPNARRPLDLLLPGQYPAGGTHILLGLRVLPLQDARVRGHVADNTVRVVSAADVPPRVPPLDGGVMCYLWLQTAQSLFPVALVTNASVHVVMYSYYLLCAVGARPKWKRLVTNGQIVQFLFSFAVSVVMLWYHFGGSDPGCSGFWGWCFNAVFNASLLALFVNFHVKNYAGAGKRKRM